VHTAEQNGANTGGTEGSEGSNLPLVIGASVGAVAFVALVAGFLVVKKKRQQPNNAFASPPPGTLAPRRE